MSKFAIQLARVIHYDNIIVEAENEHDAINKVNTAIEDRIIDIDKLNHITIHSHLRNVTWLVNHFNDVNVQELPQHEAFKNN